MEAAARAKGLQLDILKAGTEGEIDAAFASLIQTQVGALVVQADPLFINGRDQLVALASRHAEETWMSGTSPGKRPLQQSFLTALMSGPRSAGACRRRGTDGLSTHRWRGGFASVPRSQRNESFGNGNR